jgi:hypothetical protein
MVRGRHLELEGRPLHVIETGRTDTVDTTSLHVPDLDLIVSGDVVTVRVEGGRGAHASGRLGAHRLNTMARLGDRAAPHHHLDFERHRQF